MSSSRKSSGGPGRFNAIAARASLLSLILAGGVRAQSIDYRAMEQLFREPVTTSATGKPQRVSEAPANVEIITQDDIRRSGATNIPDALQSVAGIDVRRSGIAGVEVGLRGYNQPNNPHLMVLIDGRQVYMVEYGRLTWANLPVQLDEIRQIEVIKGPNSALFGFNAAGGVINIITYDPVTDRINAATVRGGTQSFLMGSVVNTAKIGETAGLRLSAGGFSSRDFAPDYLSAVDRAARRPPFSGSFNADGRWRLTPQIEVFASGSYGNTRVSEPLLFNAQYFDEQTHEYSLRAGANFETSMGLISFSGYRNDTSESDLSVQQFGGTPFDVTTYLRQKVTVAQISDLVKLGAAHTLRVAFEYRENAVSAQLLNGRLSNTILAASSMWDWQITPDVEMTNALRLDYGRLHYDGVPTPGSLLTATDFNSVRITEVSMNSGTVWKATPLDTFRASIARGVQLPALLSQGVQIGSSGVGGVAFYGTPTLGPTIVYNAELDYDRALPAINSVLRTAVFAQRTDNVTSTPFYGTPTLAPPGTLVFRAMTVGYTTAAGAELGIRGQNARGWRWNLSYALVETTDHTSLNKGNGPISPVAYSQTTPAHVVVAGLGYSHAAWEADLLARWQSSFVDYRLGSTTGFTQRVSVDNYITLNARVGYNLTEKVTIAAVAQQLNTSRLITTAAAPTERRLIGTVTVRY